MCTDLSISKALRLLQVPESEVESFAEKNDIQDMTVKELEDKEAFAESVNQRVLFDRNYIIEKNRVSGRKEGQAWKRLNYRQCRSWS